MLFVQNYRHNDDLAGFEKRIARDDLIFQRRSGCGVTLQKWYEWVIDNAVFGMV